MRNFFQFSLLLAPLCFFFSCQAGTTASHRIGASQLSSLEGRWSGPVRGGAFDVIYSNAGPEQMLSYGKLSKDGGVRFFEFEVFRKGDNGWQMQPFPMGQPDLKFDHQPALSSADRLTFENKENDFPTRIVYDTRESGKLTITLSDPYGPAAEPEVFPLVRVR